MKSIHFFKATILLFAVTMGINAYSGIRYTPLSSSSITGAANYCQSATPSKIIFTYNICQRSTTTTVGTTLTIKWYSNTTNSNTGGTQVGTTQTRNCAYLATDTSTYTPPTSTLGTLYYYCVITFTGRRTCNSAGTVSSPTAKITVLGIPATITGTFSECVGATTTLSNTTVGGTWTSSNTTIDTISTAGVVGGLVAGNNTITYSTGCGANATHTFTVNTTPTAITGLTAVCTGSTITLGNTISGGTWTSSNTSKATVNSSTGVVTGVSSGNINITYTTGSCYKTYPDTVRTTPAAIGGVSSLCATFTTTLTDASLYGTWSSSNTAKATIDASGVVTAVAAGTTTISYSTGSCGAPATKSFTVNTQPAAITGTNVVCTGSATTSLSDVTGGGTWSSSASAKATVNTSGVVTGLANGTTNISYTISTCYSTLTVTVNNTAPNSSITGSAASCVGSTSTLNDVTSGGIWTSTNTAIATVNSSGVVTGVSNGTSTISYNTGCPSAATKIFTVYVMPVAITGTTNVCVSSTTSLSDATVGGTWSSSSSSLATVNSSGVVTGVSSGTPNISYTIGVCSQVTPVTVNPLPNAGTITGTTTYCEGDVGTLSDATAGGVWNTSNTYWALIDTSGVVTTNSYGNPIISYSVTNGCGTATTTVNITITPSAVDPIFGTLSACVPSTTSLTDSVSGGSWFSSNTTIATVNSSGVVTYVSGGNADITYTISNSCVNDTTSVTVTVNPLPTITPGTNPVVCRGATSANLPYTSTNSPTNYTITYSSAAITAGFVNVASTSLPSSPITLTVPATAAVSTYSGTLNVTNANGCASASGVAFNITVNPLPTATVSNNGPMCNGGTVNLTATPSGGVTTYSWSGANLLATTGATPSATPTTTATYSLTVSSGAGNGCSPATIYTTTVTVNPTPTATVSNNGPICIPGTVNLTATPSGGVTTYSWSGADLSATTGATPTATPTTTATYSLTVSSGSGNGCSPATIYTTTVTVGAQPTGTLDLAYSGLICYNVSQILTANITGGAGTASYTWSGPGISSSTVTSVNTYTVTPSSSGAYSVHVTYTGLSCSNADLVSVSVSPASQRWTGSISTNWHTASNWLCGVVPTATDSVIIPSGTPFTASYLVAGTANTGKLVICNGANLAFVSGATLNVYGNLVDSGNFLGQGILSLRGSSHQTISGSGKVNNIEINNSNGVSINTSADSLFVRGKVVLTSGNFTTSNNLVLEIADSTNLLNGRIDSIPTGGGSISGKVIMQQVVRSGRRAYRFWGTPFIDSIPLSQLENYMDITGYGGSTHGFTNTSSNNPSAYWYHTKVGNSSITTGGGDPGWKPFTWCKDTVSPTGVHVSADSNLVHRFEGFRLFFRGDKGQGLDGSAYIPGVSKVRMWGQVNTGDINMPLQRGNLLSSVGSPVQDYNQKSNPYPSPVDIGAVVYRAYNSGQLYQPVLYVWNPFGATAGMFLTVDESSYSQYVIPANSSYQVRAFDSLSVLSFTERDKATNISAVLLKNNTDEISLSVYDESYHIWDNLKLKFDDNATNEEDMKFDAGKPINPDLNFYSWSTDHRPLSKDSRPYKAGKIIPLGFTTNYLQKFIIKIDNYAVPKDGLIYLHDKYLEQYTLLEQGAEYSFEINKDKASQGDNRFEIRLQPSEDKIIPSTGNLSVQVFPNPATTDINIVFNFKNTETTNIRVLTLEGVCVLTKNLGIIQKGSIALSLDNIASGIYMIEFTSGNEKVIQRLIKE